MLPAYRLLAVAIACFVCQLSPAQSPQQWQVDGTLFGRNVDQSDQWPRVGEDLIRNFHNMYHLYISRDNTDQQYPYRGWFFGWVTENCNTRLGLKRGCDMIFAARAARVEGPWQVYCGQNAWDDGTHPTLWRPVIVAENQIYNSWHNGDPSVIQHQGQYYMAYSATGFNQDRIPFGQPGDQDSDLNCIMGATSPDGLNWTLTAAPILIDSQNIGQAPARPGEYMPPAGAYHRPSLLRNDHKWQLWFDAWDGRDMGMCYAENSGDFRNPADWKVIRGYEQMALSNFPNPDVVRIEDVYFAFADPSGYPPKYPEDPEQRKNFLAPWASRKICQAISLNGLDWVPVGYLERDADAQANHVPVAYVEAPQPERYWLYLSYATQIFGDYRYDRIRLRRHEVTQMELERYRKLWRQVFPQK